MNQGKYSDLFYEERLIISEITEIFNDKQYADNSLLNNLKELANKYTKLLRMTEKLVKISDSNERKLLEAETKFRSVTLSAHDAIISANGCGRIISWNNGAKNIFGYDEEEVLGKYIDILMPQRYKEAHTKAFEIVSLRANTINVTVERDCVRKDGSEFPSENSISSWKVEDEVFFTAIIRDITERKRIERLRKDTEHIVRHDLRNPLAVIIHFSEFFLESNLSVDKQKEALYKINENAYKMIYLLNQSFDLFKMEEGTYKLNAKEFNFIKLIKGLEHQFKIYQEITSTKIIYLLNGDLLSEKDVYPVIGEEVYIESLMANLIKNAFEAAPHQSKITISITHDRGSHIIDIHNFGVIPENIRDRFFDRYVTSGKVRGTGIGTYSAILIAKVHGGDISFTTSDINGTNLIVRIPKNIKNS